MSKTRVKFGALPIGAKFREVPDGQGYAFRFPLVKEEPTKRGSEICNARAGRVWFQFQDDEEVFLEVD